MSSFQFKYNTSRAEDILENNDPVVFAGAAAMRGIGLPLVNNHGGSTSSKEKNNVAYLSVRKEKIIESQHHQQKLVEENRDLTSPFASSLNQSQQEAFVSEALSLGFAIRRQRTFDDDHHRQQQFEQEEKEVAPPAPETSSSPATKKKTAPSSKSKKKGNSSSSNKKDDRVNDAEEEATTLLSSPIKFAAAPPKINVPKELEHHLLLTTNELQRLRTSMTNYHQTTTRSESKSLFEKMTERLAIQRATFVNEMIQSERRMKDKNSTIAQDVGAETEVSKGGGVEDEKK